MSKIFTSNEIVELFIEEYFYPDIQAKGESEESENMRVFVKNFINAYIIPNTKLYVKAALKEASKKAETITCDIHGQDICDIDEESILNAYPLTNII